MLFQLFQKLVCKKSTYLIQFKYFIVNNLQKDWKIEIYVFITMYTSIKTTMLWLFYAKNVDIKFSAHDAFLE